MKTIFEQAMFLDKFMDRLYNHHCQIVENCCLIIYAKENDSLYLNHWVTKLESHLNRIIVANLKCGDKKEAIINELIGNDDLDNVNQIYKIVKRKFKKERIELKEEYCQHFVDCLDDLIKCLVEEISIDDFLEKL